MEDIFNHTIRAEYRKKVYNTKQIAGHIHDPIKKQQKIQNQKNLMNIYDYKIKSSKSYVVNGRNV